MIKRFDSPTLAPAHPGLLRPAEKRSGFRSLLRKILLGPEGLRSGWRFLLYLAMGTTILLLLVSIIKTFPNRPHGVWVVVVDDGVYLVAGLISARIMAVIEGRCFGAYGLPVRFAFRKDFWAGVLWGLSAISVLILAMRAAGLFYFGGLAIRGTGILKFAALYVVVFLIIGFSEEFLLRGYSQFTLARGIRFWPAAVLLSIAFGANHMGHAGQTWLGGVSAGFFGLFLALTLRRTGTLWFAVGLHAAWNWGQTFLYSAPDSGYLMPGHLLNSAFQGSSWLTGGTDGPEGSILIFLLLALMWVLFDRTYREVNYPE